MEKRGTIFHWIMFGVLIAIGIVIFSTTKLSTEVEDRGEWQANFLKDPFADAEIDLLKNDLAAKKTGLIIAEHLAENGGFNSNSPCGQLDNINLWNKERSFCFPNINQELNNLFNLEFEKFIPNRKFLSVNFKEYYLYGYGEKKVIENYQPNYQKYVYDTSFTVNLGYTFNEYQQLKEEAVKLVDKCADFRNLELCLNKNKPEHWKYSSCDNKFPEILTGSTENNRQIQFCIESPNKAILFDQDKKILTYNLALDFNSKLPFSPLNLIVDFNPTQNLVKLSFAQENADSYRIYYTNWVQAKDKTGKPEEIFLTLPSGLGFFKKTVYDVLVADIVSQPDTLVEDCTSFRTQGKAYLCQNKIYYLLSDLNLISGQKYLLTITSVKDGKESLIESFTEFS